MPEMRVLQCWPEIWATSMTSRPESVQYRFPATQSTAIPRGIFSSLIWTWAERPLQTAHRFLKVIQSKFHQLYLQVGDPALILASVLRRVGGRRGRRIWQIIRGNASGVPVGPEDAVCLDVQIHGINSDACIALEDLLIAPVRHPRIQAPDFIIISYVENLPTAVHICKKREELENSTNKMIICSKGRSGAVPHCQLCRCH